MKLFKTLQAFFRRMFLSITPSGRSTLMYEKAYDNINETHTITVLEKRIVKSSIRYYINKVLKKKRLSDFQINFLVNKKFEKDLKSSGLKFHTGYPTLFKDA